MKHLIQFGLVTAAFGALLIPAAISAAQTTKKTTPKASSSTSKTKTSKKATQKKAAKAPARPAKPEPSAQEFVARAMEEGVSIPAENPAALIPFFEQLYRHQQGELPGPVRILQYGDSHTAADEFSGQLRMLFQASFGNGGSGFSMAGRPWKSYRRRDVKSGSTNGWYTDGLVARKGGDGVYGLGGIAMTAKAPRESIYIDAEASEFELFYYQQPGGGAVQLYDSGVALDVISTEGEAGPGYYRVEAAPGPHRFEVETVSRDPVRLFGWVAENPTGITYETLGINGASVVTAMQWDTPTLRANIQHRNPDLIVIAYGTNEAGSPKWTVESYQAMFEDLLRGFREGAPTASILVIGPPDRSQRIKKKWQTLNQVGVIAEAQRRAAIAVGAAFIDLRAEMGGPGSMEKWVKAGAAQADRVHFTAQGYHLLGDAVYTDIMSQYWVFLKARAAILATSQPLQSDGAK